MKPRDEVAAHAAHNREQIDSGEPRSRYTGSDLRGAYLRSAYLRGANLSGSDLRGANLIGSDLRGSDLRGANLRGANLSGSDFIYADLQGTDLRGADLRGANLNKVYLRGADLRGANGLPLNDAESLDLRRRVSNQIEQHPETHVQSSWHCSTGHCAAGWTTTLAGHLGRELEMRLGCAVAAHLLLAGRTRPSFDRDAERDAIIRDLRAGTEVAP